jgi:hypothetical protein
MRNKTNKEKKRKKKNIETRHIMKKPEKEEALRQDTKWTNQRHRQHWDKTQNGQTRDTCSIKTSH